MGDFVCILYAFLLLLFFFVVFWLFFFFLKKKEGKKTGLFLGGRGAGGRG